MSYTARLVGGPCDGQTFFMESGTVEYVDPEPEDTQSLSYYVFAGEDSATGERLFRWVES